jgi:hypothetical protein
MSNASLFSAESEINAFALILNVLCEPENTSKRVRQND